MSTADRAGSSLIETIVAIAIGSIAALMIVAIMTTGMSSLRAARRMERLHANAAIIADQFAVWTKRAKIAAVPNADTLVLTLPDGTNKTFARSGASFNLDGSSLLDDNIEVVRTEFVPLARSVRMAYGLRTKNNSDLFEATTTIAFRNHP